MIRNLKLSLLSFILLSTLFTAGYAAPACRDLFDTQSKSSTWSTLSERTRITETNHHLDANTLLESLNQQGILLYKGDHQYVPGTEFLASNEFDWARTPIDNVKTDVIVGFGTNTVWDIALRKKAKFMVIGDWSPWPVISQAYLISPLIRLASTPQQLILMLSGMPKELAEGVSLHDAFEMAEAFDSTPPSRQKPKIEKLLSDLAKDPNISDLELKFLTTYFRPRMNDNLSPRGFGPFARLRSASFALLNSFYSRRYDPVHVGDIESVFSSVDNFNYLKSMFVGGKIIYGITSITDANFYNKIKNDKRFKGISELTLSITNIFDCGGYNGLTFSDLQNYLKSVASIFKKPLVVFRTTNNSPPHGFYRYEINSEKDVPLKDESDSTALTDEAKKAG